MRIAGVALALGSGTSFIAAVAVPYSPETPTVVPPAAAEAAAPRTDFSVKQKKGGIPVAVRQPR
jgi:hypothetical protein